MSGRVTNPLLSNTTQSSSGANIFGTLIPGLIGLGFIVGVIIFLFILAIAAIQWITAGGDKAALESARGKVFNALLGIIILLAVFAILSFIQTVLGVNILVVNFDVLRLEAIPEQPLPPGGPGV